DLATLDELPLLAEHAKRDALRVNVQSDVKHKAPLENRRTSGLKPLLSRYPIDRGFLHSFTPTHRELRVRTILRSRRTGSVCSHASFAPALRPLLHGQVPLSSLCQQGVTSALSGRPSALPGSAARPGRPPGSSTRRGRSGSRRAAPPSCRRPIRCSGNA